VTVGVVDGCLFDVAWKTPKDFFWKRAFRSHASKSLAETEGVYIYGDAAVDGMARVDKVDAEPLEGLDGDASAKIEVVDTAARGDGVCMIYGGGAGILPGADIDGGSIRNALVGLGVAKKRHDAEPGKDGNLVAQVYVEELVVIPLGVAELSIKLVLGGGHVEIQVNAPGKQVHAQSKAGILGVEGHLAKMGAYLITVVIAGEIE